jgi:hypothetical protein
VTKPRWSARGAERKEQVKTGLEKIQTGEKKHNGTSKILDKKESNLKGRPELQNGEGWTVQVTMARYFCG